MTIATNHRLVNTTPKPSATKKSSGELVGPFELLDEDVDIVGAALVEVGVVIGVGVGSGNCVDVCVPCEYTNQNQFIA
jgi:hypothetical protein